MKHLSLFLVLLGLLMGGAVFAQSEEELAAIGQAESVSLQDLGVEDPGILPTSPFYIFKELGRGIQSLFTFNRVAKAELEVKFANEKAAELKAVQEQKPDDGKAIERALANFQRSQERLKARLERVKETSENPNVDKLLSRVAEKSVLHEKLLQEVRARHEDKEQVRLKVEELKERVAGVVQGLAALDTAEQFTERLKNALEAAPGSSFKHIRSVEFLDNVQENLPEEVKIKLEGVREEFKDRVKEKIEIERDGEKLKAIFERIPGDNSRRAVILEELRLKVSDKAAEAIEKVQERVEEKISDSLDRAEKTAEQIRRAGEMIGKAQEKLRETDVARPAAQELLSAAERHLASAKQAFEDEDYGEAFGQARASEIAARNVLRALEEKLEKGPDPIILQRVQEKVRERILLPESVRPIQSEEGVACTQEYKPVCGTDRETYSNRCVAEQQNRVKVSYEGECRDEDEDEDENETEDREAENKGPVLELNPANILQKLVPRRLDADSAREAE